MTRLESLYQILLPWLSLLTISSVVMALASSIALPWLLLRLPADYFIQERQTTPHRSPLDWLVWLLRNSLALLLFILGVLMLVLPGQGLLTILISVGLSTAPGKYRLERSLIRRPTVFNSINWVRRRYQRPAIIHPDDPHNSRQS